MSGWIFVYEATLCLMRGADERFLWHGYKAFGKRDFDYGIFSLICCIARSILSSREHGVSYENPYATV